MLPCLHYKKPTSVRKMVTCMWMTCFPSTDVSSLNTVRSPSSSNHLEFKTGIVTSPQTSTDLSSSSWPRFFYGLPSSCHHWLHWGWNWQSTEWSFTTTYWHGALRFLTDEACAAYISLYFGNLTAPNSLLSVPVCELPLGVLIPITELLCYWRKPKNLMVLRQSCT